MSFVAREHRELLFSRARWYYVPGTVSCKSFHWKLSLDPDRQEFPLFSKCARREIYGICAKFIETIRRLSLCGYFENRSQMDRKKKKMTNLETTNFATVHQRRQTITWLRAANECLCGCGVAPVHQKLINKRVALFSSPPTPSSWSSPAPFVPRIKYFICLWPRTRDLCISTDTACKKKKKKKKKKKRKNVKPREWGGGGGRKKEERRTYGWTLRDVHCSVRRRVGEGEIYSRKTD